MPSTRLRSRAIGPRRRGHGDIPGTAQWQPVPTDPLRRQPNSAAATWRPEALRGARRIGLGLAALGRPAYITTGREVDLGLDRSVESMRQRTETVLDAAYEAGIRYVDAARSYGLAENFLGGWLAQRGVSPEDIVVGSKWGY